ncbi:MAG: helix-turn-helix domain-containing protein [Candidatus Kapaibacteriota bacterium]
MENLNKEIGERIRFIRSIFNEGGKLSASQFAHLLGETMHKILNYELGRAQVPPSFLATLYYRGINPIFILTGEGSIFAPNRAGEVLQERLSPALKKIGFQESRAGGISTDEMKLVDATDDKFLDRDVDQLIELARRYTAVAGDLMEIIKKRSQNG